MPLITKTGRVHSRIIFLGVRWSNGVIDFVMPWEAVLRFQPGFRPDIASPDTGPLLEKAERDRHMQSSRTITALQYIHAPAIPLL
jgi:hypothetical protein